MSFDMKVRLDARLALKEGARGSSLFQSIRQDRAPLLELLLQHLSVDDVVLCRCDGVASPLKLVRQLSASEGDRAVVLRLNFDDALLLGSESSRQAKPLQATPLLFVPRFLELLAERRDLVVVVLATVRESRDHLLGHPIQWIFANKLLLYVFKHVARLVVLLDVLPSSLRVSRLRRHLLLFLQLGQGLFLKSFDVLLTHLPLQRACEEVRVDVVAGGCPRTLHLGLQDLQPRRWLCAEGVDGSLFADKLDGVDGANGDILVHRVTSQLCQGKFRPIVPKAKLSAFLFRLLRSFATKADGFLLHRLGIRQFVIDDVRPAIGKRLKPHQLARRGLWGQTVEVHHRTRLLGRLRHELVNFRRPCTPAGVVSTANPKAGVRPSSSEASERVGVLGQRIFQDIRVQPQDNGVEQLLHKFLPHPPDVHVLVAQLISVDLTASLQNWIPPSKGRPGDTKVHQLKEARRLRPDLRALRGLRALLRHDPSKLSRPLLRFHGVQTASKFKRVRVGLGRHQHVQAALDQLIRKRLRRRLSTGRSPQHFKPRFQHAQSVHMLLPAIQKQPGATLESAENTLEAQLLFALRSEGARVNFRPANSGV
eukprot:scaffold2191_cov254-Pinguiococcus_pyrenoidosus.AAC.8